MKELETEPFRELLKIALPVPVSSLGVITLGFTEPKGKR
jgi:hypothetical protein